MSSPGRGEDGSFTREVGTQTGKAIVLIAIAVLVAVVLLHHRSGPTTVTSKASTTTAPAPPASVTTSTAPLAAPSGIKVLVLNGTGAGVLAGQFTMKLKEMGYQTQTPDNTTKTVDGSTVYVVNPKFAAEGQFLAQQLGLPSSAVAPSLPTDAPIASSEQKIADIILVVGSDLANKA
ncbi:MAG: LytR C-terminal domain-containing protein [Actinomycetota bacterium]|nr:LytR C-terminal domain-containing protein [Actinomycetota bacterium]